MLRKRYYILFVARDEDGRVRKIPLPLRYVYGFVAAALVGAFTIVGLAGSYTRMLLKTESFNQVRQERRDAAQKLPADGPDRARPRRAGSLAGRAGQRSDRALWAEAEQTDPCQADGLRRRRRGAHSHNPSTHRRCRPAGCQAFHRSVLHAAHQAMSGRVSRALEGGLSPSFAGDWTELADAPRSGLWRAAWHRASASARTRSTVKAHSTPASNRRALRHAGARRRRRRRDRGVDGRRLWPPGGPRPWPRSC